jgi:hypothetical protein
LSCAELVSQGKYEREFRIDEKDVPKLAIQFIDSCKLGTKIKWYKEMNMTGHTFEAKTKFSGRRFSIEFDTSGIIQDVEVLTKFNSLPIKIKIGIQNRLKTDFNKFKISKIQQQWTGETKSLIILINNLESIYRNELRYEIVAHCVFQKQRFEYEYLFNSSGQFEKRRKIISMNTDHIEF